jgi:hypothetical protein
MQFLIGLQIIKDLDCTLQDQHNVQNNKLEETRTLVRNIILGGFQVGILNNEILLDDSYAVEDIWGILRVDTNLDLIQKKAILTTSYYDCIIITDQIISYIKVNSKLN